MANLAKLIDIPPRNLLNPGLSRLRPSSALQLLGTPGSVVPRGCGTPNARTQARLATRHVANLQFSVTLMEPLLDSLEAIFEEVRREDPEVFDKARTNGATCVRRIDGSTSFSLHSYGLAIDLGFGREGPGGFIEADPRGDGMCEEGLLRLLPFFNRNGWFSGMAFGGSAEDSMHFEASEQLIRKILAGRPIVRGSDQQGGPGILKHPSLAADPVLAEVAANRQVLQRSGVRLESVGILQDGLNALKKQEFTVALGPDGRFRGFFGPKTESAVMNFQQSESLEADGVVGSNTIQALDARLVKADGTGPLKHMMLRGSEALQAVAAGQRILERSAGQQAGVGELQDALNTLGVAKPRFKIDLGDVQQFRGLYGPKTEAAVRNFQEDTGLDPDGRVGQNTILAIDDALGRLEPGETPNVQGRIITGPGGYLPPEGVRAALGAIPLGEASELDPLDFGITESDVDALFRFSSDVLFFEGGMQTDADGSPRAKEIDRFGQLETAFTYPNQSGQKKFVDAEKVNYIVLPGNNRSESDRFFRKMGIKLGDVATVLFDGKVEFAMFADVGPRNKMGEGSVHLVQTLGVDPFINGKIRRGIPEEVVYIVFPGSRPTGLTPGNVNSKVAASAKRLFESLGGVPL